jgi:hypothetical protein
MRDCGVEDTFYELVLMAMTRNRSKFGRGFVLHTTVEPKDEGADRGEDGADDIDPGYSEPRLWLRLRHGDVRQLSV